MQGNNNMDRIKLTKEILSKMLENIDNKTEMEFYYQAALEDRIEAKRYTEIVLFLLILVLIVNYLRKEK